MTAPRDALAAALDGTPIGRDSIQVGADVIWCSVGGVVRANGVPIGKWSDGAEVLAAAYRAAVAEAVGA